MLKMTKGTIVRIASSFNAELKSLNSTKFEEEKTYLPVDEEGSKCKGLESQMDNIVGNQLYLALHVRCLAVRDNVVEGDISEQVQQATDQANHQDPD